jgi:hypothetical protein
VRELQRRQQEDVAREERRLKAISEKEAAEKDKKAQLRMQEEAFALRLQVTTSLIACCLFTNANIHYFTLPSIFGVLVSKIPPPPPPHLYITPLNPTPSNFSCDQPPARSRGTGTYL